MRIIHSFHPLDNQEQLAMHNHLDADRRAIRALLAATFAHAADALEAIESRPVAVQPVPRERLALPQAGIGGAAALDVFRDRYWAELSGSAGPRYLGFVTGGATPASIMGDWLVTTFDQNPAGSGDSGAPEIEHETLAMLRQLFGLSDAHSGAFVSGATMSNMVGLALGRQWVGEQRGHDPATNGLYGLPSIKLLSGSPHSSVYKALSMLGMGRRSVQTVSLYPAHQNREAVDVAELRKALDALNGEPCIVVGNAGTVNTVDFDDLQAIANLKREYAFWLHVDAAFGGFAACSPQFRHLTAGLDQADSICIDAHKWLNVPYDSAMQFTRHRALQVKVFQNSAAYLGLPGDNPDFVHLTPENSRRFRALPAWFTLMAYGADGCREIVERNCDTARLLGEMIAASDSFRMLAPVRMNVVCFALAERYAAALNTPFLAALRDGGQTFMTPTVYKGTTGLRAAFSNWRTTRGDVEAVWVAMQEALKVVS
jgi:glutamate/tyrosine decarboxylase-like PLP-dependent enzyme